MPEKENFENNLKNEQPEEQPEKEKFLVEEGEVTQETLKQQLEEKAERALVEIKKITEGFCAEIKKAQTSVGSSKELDEIQMKVEKISRESLNQILTELKGILPEEKIREILESVKEEVLEKRSEKTPEESQKRKPKEKEFLKEEKEKEEILSLENLKRMSTRSLKTLDEKLRQEIRALEKQDKERSYKDENLENKIIEFEKKLRPVELILFQRKLAQKAREKIKKIDKKIENLKEQIKEGEKKLGHVTGQEFDELDQKLKDLEKKIYDLENEKQMIQKETEEEMKAIDDELKEKKTPLPEGSPEEKSATEEGAEEGTKEGAAEKGEIPPSPQKETPLPEGSPEEGTVEEGTVEEGEVPPSPETKLRCPPEDNIKILKYVAKIEASYLSEEEKKRLLEKVRFVDSENISKEQKENIDKLIDQLLKIGKDLDLKEQEAIISALSENLGISQEKLNQIYLAQLNKLETLSQMRYESKEKGWKKWGKILGKVAIYAGAGTALSFVTGGVAAGAIVAGVRAIENWFAGKKREKELLRAKEEMRVFLSSDSDEGKAFKEEIYKNLIAQLAVAKQEEIDLKTREARPDLDLIKSEEDYLKDPSETNRKKVEQALNTLQIDQANSIYNYLKERNKTLSEAERLTDEEIEERVRLVENLLALEKRNELIGLDFRLKNKGFIEKLAEKFPSLPVDQVLDIPKRVWGLLAGGRTTGEKVATSIIYGTAGVLARSCPGLRRVLFGIAGAKLGETGAGLIIAKASRYEILKNIQARMLESENATDLANFPEDLLARAKTQLLDKNFAQSNPEEYARLKEAIFKIELAKVKLSEEFIEKANQDLENTTAEKLKMKKESKVLKAGMMIGGAVLGILGGEALTKYLSERVAKTKAKTLEQQKTLKSERITEKTSTLESKPQEVVSPEVPRSSEVFIETARNGDNVWKMIERVLERQIKSGKLNLGTQDPAKIEAYKTYVIDAIKNKIAQNPSEYGLRHSINLIHPGEKLDLTRIFENKEFIDRILARIFRLSSENIQNILKNNEVIKELVSRPVRELSNKELINLINMTGGVDQAPLTAVNEFYRRIAQGLLSEAKEGLV